jgi:hypothetical protein
MKFLLKTLALALTISVLSGCLASGVTPVGVRCGTDTDQGPVWDWPLVCQPNGG